MKKPFITALAATFILVSLAVATAAQTTTVTKVQTVQNPDGTYSIIEYPVGKQTIVTLNPVGLSGATGTATIVRDPTKTTIKLNLTGLPTDSASVNVYAIDPTGALTLLGPVQVTNGAGTFTTTTPMSKFMLIASPEASLTTYRPETKILFRSSVPEGFAVIPLSNSGERDGAAVGERVSATTTAGASSYSVPMLNIPGFRRGTDTHLKVNFSGAMSGARANVFIEPRKDGPSEVRMRFHELKEVPAGKVYVLWAVSPDNKFVKLGQIVNAPGRNEAEIRSETALTNFGLLVTMEDEVTSPIGPPVGVVVIQK